MSDELPSSAPEKTGSDESAATKSNQNCETNPKKKNTPRKPRPAKWFGLSETKWRELAGIAVLIPWVWNEFLDTHNFAKLCLLAITIAVAQGATLTFFKSRWRGFILAVWLISLVPVATVVWLNSRPEPKPHFILSLQIGDSRKSAVILTNDCLFRAEVVNVITNFPNGFTFFNGIAGGSVIIPVQTDASNSVFSFIVENDSPITIKVAT